MLPIYITQAQLRQIEGWKLPPISQRQLQRKAEQAKKHKLMRLKVGCARVLGRLPIRLERSSGDEPFVQEETVTITKDLPRHAKRRIDMSRRALRMLSADDVDLVKTVRRLRLNPRTTDSDDGDTTDDNDYATTGKQPREWQKMRALKAKGKLPPWKYGANREFVRTRQRDGSYKRVILEQHFDKRASFEKQDFNSLELNDSAIPRDHLNPNWWLSHDTAASLANFSWDEADIADWLDSLSFTFSGSH